MNLMKNFAYLIAICTLGVNVALASSGLSEKQAKNYIKQVVYNLFGADHTSKTLQSIDTFISKINSDVLSRSYIQGTFSTKKVYDVTLDHVVNFIEQKSKEYALEALDKKSNHDKYAKASRIANKIASQVRSIINNHSWLENGVFSNYIGSNLKNKVENLVGKGKKHFNKQYSHKHGHKHVYTDYYYEPVSIVNPVTCYQPVCQPVVYQPVVKEVYTEYVTPVYQPCFEPVPTAGFYFKQPKWGFSFNVKA